MKKTWKKLGSKIVYQNQWVTLREDKVIRPDGTKGVYNYLENPSGSSVFIVALTKKQEIYLICQYRYPTKQFSWEVPGGCTDKDSIQDAAKRELQEETGVISKSIKHIGSFQSLNGVSNEISHVFLATELQETQENKQEEEGIQEVKKIHFSEVIRMIRKGELTDGQSLNAIFLTALYLNYPINKI